MNKIFLGIGAVSLIAITAYFSLDEEKTITSTNSKSTPSKQQLGIKTFNEVAVKPVKLDILKQYQVNTQIENDKKNIENTMAKLDALIEKK